MSFIEYWVGYEVVGCTRESLGSAVRQDCLRVQQKEWISPITYFCDVVSSSQ